MKGLLALGLVACAFAVFAILGSSSTVNAQQSGAEAGCFPSGKSATATEQTINKFCDVSKTFSLNEAMVCCVKK